MTIKQKAKELRLVKSVQRAKRAYLDKQKLYAKGEASQQAVETARRVWRERRHSSLTTARAFGLSARSSLRSS